MGHVAGEGLLDGFGVGSAAELGLMVAGRVAVAVRVIVDAKTHVEFDVFWLD